MDVAIRRVELEDLPCMVELMNEHAAFERSPPPAATHAALADALLGERPSVHGWVAVMDGTVVGYMTATIDFSTWQAAPFIHMDCLYVRSSHRSGGIGALLVAALRDFAIAGGFSQIQWQTPEWNLDAARFYLRLGAGEAMKRRFTLAVPARRR